MRSWRGTVCCEILKRLGIKVECFIDNSKDKLGTQFHEIPVCSLGEALNRYSQSGIYILIASTRFSEQIERQLLKKGLRKRKDFLSLCDWAGWAVNTCLKQLKWLGYDVRQQSK